MNTPNADHLYTSPLPQSQHERWNMVTGLIDHLVTPDANKSSIVSRTIADQDNGSYAVNEGMDRIGKLLNAIKAHPAPPAAVPDLFKGKAEMLIESDAYHTLVNLHAATKPRAGHDHYASVIMAVSGPTAHRMWATVHETLPGEWEATKAALSRNVLAVAKVSMVPAMPDLKTPQPSLNYPVGAGKTGVPVSR